MPVAVLTDFEELKIYIVGGKPHMDEPQVGEWKSWRFQQYPLIARELWDLLARDKIAAGSIDAALEALPKKPAGKGKARQQWLIKPDRTRALDTDFLEFLDETRRDLASDLWKNNDHDELLDGNKLTEACQRVIDRILFLRICEDRDIDTGRTLQSLVATWRKNTGDDDTGRRAHQQPLDALREEPPADYGSSGFAPPKIRSGAPLSGISARWIAARPHTFPFSMATSSSRISPKASSLAMNGWPGSSVI